MPSDLVVIELAGTPGAGKTTVAAALVHEPPGERIRGVHDRRCRSPSRPPNHRGPPAGPDTQHPAPSTRARYVFYLGGVSYGLTFAVKHRDLVRHVIRACRMHRVVGDAIGETHATFWFVQLCGRVAFLRATARSGEILVVDDGFLHRAVHLHASTLGTVDVPAVQEYTSLVPRPDLLVHLTVPPDLCRRGSGVGGIWAHARDIDDVRLVAYLESAHVAVNSATERAGELGWRTFIVQNSERHVADVVTDLGGALDAFDEPERVDVSGSPTMGRLPRLPRPLRVRAMAASRFGPPALPPDRVHAVLAQYGLAPGSGTHSDLRIGRRSLNAAVPTPFGTKVVKQYRPQWTEARVEYGHAVVDRLEELSFPSVRLARTLGGRTYTVIAGSVYAVFDFIEGTSYSLTFLRRGIGWR